jgi:hypothetical protein
MKSLTMIAEIILSMPFKDPIKQEILSGKEIN